MMNRTKFILMWQVYQMSLKILYVYMVRQKQNMVLLQLTKKRCLVVKLKNIKVNFYILIELLDQHIIKH